MPAYYVLLSINGIYQNVNVNITLKLFYLKFTVPFVGTFCICIDPDYILIYWNCLLNYLQSKNNPTYWLENILDIVLTFILYVVKFSQCYYSYFWNLEMQNVFLFKISARIFRPVKKRNGPKGQKNVRFVSNSVVLSKQILLFNRFSIAFLLHFIVCYGKLML